MRTAFIGLVAIVAAGAFACSSSPAPATGADDKAATAETPPTEAPAAETPAEPAPTAPMTISRETVGAWFDAYCPSGGDNNIAVADGIEVPRADIPFAHATALPIPPSLSVTPDGMLSERAAYRVDGAPRPFVAKGPDDAAGRAADQEAVRALVGGGKVSILVGARVPGWRAWDVLTAPAGDVSLRFASSRAPAMPANPDPARMTELMAEMEKRQPADVRMRWLSEIGKANAAACPPVAEAYDAVRSVETAERCAALAKALKDATAGCTDDAVRGVLVMHYLMHPKVPYLLFHPWRAPAERPAWADAATPWGEVLGTLVAMKR